MTPTGDNPNVLDLTGLPADVQAHLRSLVASLRKAAVPPGQRKSAFGLYAHLGRKMPDLEVFQENRREMAPGCRAGLEEFAGQQTAAES